MECHSKRRGDLLTIHCLGCGGGQDLTSLRCLRGVLDVLSRERGVRDLVLSGYWEILHSGECVAVLKEMASILAFCRERAEEESPMAQCRECRINPSDFYDEVRRNLPHLPDAEKMDRWALRPSRDRDHCDSCVERRKRDMDRIEERFRSMGAGIVRPLRG
ncbi:MAG: hypothetical protein ACLFUV_02780 [Methanomassiliicoccales archaeon]